MRLRVSYREGERPVSNKKLSNQAQKYQLVQEDYDGIADYYDDRYNAAEEFAAQFTDFVTSLPSNAVVADIGSGPGKEASTLATVVQKVVAVDLSATMLAKVKEKNPAIETVQANMNHMPFPDKSFDAIWCSRAIIHVPQEDLAQTLQEFHRVLQPEGVLGLLFRTPDEGISLKEEFLPETAPNSEGLVYYRNLYSEVYMIQALTHIGFAIEKRELGVSRDNEVSLYLRARSVQ